MGEKTASDADCRKIHSDLYGKGDGCQEFMASQGEHELECAIYGCHRNFHIKVEEYAPVKYTTEVVYTACNKNHSIYQRYSMDGCKEVTPSGEEGTTEALTCTVCGCHKGYHRNEVSKEVPISFDEA
ncbi:Hypothetical predicted protein [Olea europaea subsp. europaea]|uniref:ZF-HD dimerization-type domain-containing protein n=1 Tax=Olea europaea subsp. europaea TaxID=158383 RepID=A0A8S0RW91_OLEEU|nr:Hypothetical predicted protein [Olea europaea subsp. europaea]